MDLFIPPALEQTIAEFGAEGAQWRNSLPDRVADLERRWHFRVGPALDHGGCVSWIAPVQRDDGSEAILKIGIPHDEARTEADALRFWDGQGAIRLLEASEDGFSLLLERCVPGNDLWSLDEEQGDAAAAQMLTRLWRQPATATSFQTLTDMVAHWCEEIPQIAAAGGYDPHLVAHALDLARELAANQPIQVLLHGDFHPGNVLAAQREPWLVIDPKPILGDPAYDLAQWLGNRVEAAMQTSDPVGVLQHQVRRFADRLGLEPARIAGWAFVKALGWEWGPGTFAIFHKALYV